VTHILPPGHAPGEPRWTEEQPHAGGLTDPRFSKVYRSGRRRSRYAIGLLALMGALFAVSVSHDVAGFGLIARAEDGTLTLADANAYDAFSTNLLIVSFVLYVPCGIAFLAWLSRSIDNVPVLGGGIPVASPRWSIGWWFIPFMSLWKPYQVVKDLNTRMAAGPATGGALLLAWWLCFIVGNFMARVVTRLPEPQDLDGLRTVLTVSMIGETVTLVAAGLAIYAIFHVQGLAEQRAAGLSAPPQGSTIPAAPLTAEGG
jgi:hypothetical protein